MILDEIVRLQNIPEEEMVKWYSDMKEILIHNYNHFMNNNHLQKSGDKFLKAYNRVVR